MDGENELNLVSCPEIDKETPDNVTHRFVSCETIFFNVPGSIRTVVSYAPCIAVHFPDC